MGRFASVCASFASILAISFGAFGAGNVDDADEAAWKIAKRDATDEAFQRYLSDFPTGRYMEYAFFSLVDKKRIDTEPLIEARFKDRGERGRPESFGPPGRPDIGPPGLY